jgi:hypothetical protein
VHQDPRPPRRRRWARCPDPDRPAHRTARAYAQGVRRPTTPEPLARTEAGDRPHRPPFLPAAVMAKRRAPCRLGRRSYTRVGEHTPARMEGGVEMAKGTVERKCLKGHKAEGSCSASCLRWYPRIEHPTPTGKAAAGSTTSAATPPRPPHDRRSTRRAGAAATTWPPTVHAPHAGSVPCPAGRPRPLPRSTSCWTSGWPTCKPRARAGCGPSAATTNFSTITSAHTWARSRSARYPPCRSSACTTTLPTRAARTASPADYTRAPSASSTTACTKRSPTLGDGTTAHQPRRRRRAARPAHPLHQLTDARAGRPPAGCRPA